MESDDLPLFSGLTPRKSSTSTKAIERVPSAPNGDESAPMSVSELNRRVKGLLEANFELGWVRGELSNVMRAASGHWYFSLKDDAAQVRCVMFRQRAQAVDFTPENGIQVDVRALPSLYEARGEFQLGVETMRRVGVGALFEAFERLKRKLAGESLFDDARKRALPGFPRRVGIVTSTKAAALRDVLTTFRRRAPMIEIIIYATAVQGADAARDIAAAIDAARVRAEVDALLICRGGGAAEDLWSFNDELVARAIHRLQQETNIPVVSGVGHETDFTICDFVADVRAPTPTAAAEMLSPDTVKLRANASQTALQLHRSVTRHIARLQQHLDMAARGLVSPEQRIARERNTLAHFGARLGRGLQYLHATQRQRLTAQNLRLSSAVAHATDTLKQWLAQRGQALSLLNPQHVLQRGYAMVTRATPANTLVTARQQLKASERVVLRFHDGDAEAEIK